MCFSTPKAAPPALPDPLPDPARAQDPAVVDAANQTRSRARAARGSASTVLTANDNLNPSAVQPAKKLTGQ